VVVVSDLQQGSRLEALGASDWPSRVELALEPVRPRGGSNAALQALADPGGDAPTALRVRVTNAEGSGERFRLRWLDQGSPLEVAVPPGQSRVVEAPGGRAERPGTLVLDGDDQDFDDRLAVAPPLPTPVRILYLGNDDGKDAARPLFYLQRAFPVTRLRAPQITALGPDQVAAIDPATQLVVVTDVLGPAAQRALRGHLDRGRAALVVLERPAPWLAALVPGLVVSESAGREEYALLTAVDLGHPVLAPFADPRFGDFTKIRFWHHRRIDERRLPGARVLARFDDGAPAWLTVPVGKGTLYLMTSGWQPADSQLALSSKFVPLLHGIVEASAGLDSGQSQFVVGDPVTLPRPAWRTRVRTPDGRMVDLADGATAFAGTDAPGLYLLEGPGGKRPFAVNLDPAESATAPLPPEAFDRLGLTPGRRGVAAADHPRAREQAFHAGLEREQGLWRWLIVGALLLVLAETAVARRTRVA
jgi:hypothetical protein